jgi:hypothetical protein
MVIERLLKKVAASLFALTAPRFTHPRPLLLHLNIRPHRTTLRGARGVDWVLAQCFSK